MKNELNNFSFHQNSYVMVIIFLLFFLQTCQGQDENCTPSKSIYKNLSNKYKGEALVIDPNNSIGFWKTDNPINVCWENSSDYNTFNAERDAVKIAITNTWQKNSGLRFSGWDKCKASNDDGIHIKVSNTQPITKCLGVALNGKKDGMTLNFNFTDKAWGQGVKKEYQSKHNGVFNKIELIQALAIHEFGHAIGLAHFHTNNLCHVCNEFEDFQKRDKFDKIGLWLVEGCEDTYSVMNYCLSNYLNGGDLSPYDKKIIGILYGSPTNNTKTKKYKLEYNVSNTQISVINTDSTKNKYLNLGEKLIDTSKKTDAKPTKEQQEKMDLMSSQQQRGNQIQVQQAFFDNLKANWYHVRVKLSGSVSDMNKVETVQYYLYEKMENDDYNPVTNLSSNFSLSYYCWGKFQIKAIIKLKDKTIITDYITPNIPDFYWTGNDGKEHKASGKNAVLLD